MEPAFTNIIIGVGFRTYFCSVARYQETPTLSLFLLLDLWFNIFIEQGMIESRNCISLER